MTVESLPAAQDLAAPGAVLKLTSALNARDLGDHVGFEGRRVRRGVLFRSGALNRLTEDDVLALGRLRLSCLVDFRHPHEVEAGGADRLPVPPPARVVRLPVYHLEHDVFAAVTALLTGRAGSEVADVLREDHDSGGAAEVMRGLYRWFVHSPVACQAFSATLRLVATAEALPLLFHCTAGKDRTGWLAAVVLSTLGVERAAVLADYLRTNELNANASARVIASVQGRLAEPSLLMPLLEARAEYLHAAFAEVERSYGGMDGYLRDGLGLDEATLADLHANLLHD